MATNPSHKARVAGGAGYALAARLGAIIEAASFIAFTWLYGAATFGLYAVLWSYVKVTSALSELAMATALQRFVPKAADGEENQIAGYAIKLSFIVSSLVALIFTLIAPSLAGFINASEADSEHLVTVMRIYAWVLPFWCLVNVATAAVRATRTFGPEVRVRIFYEQGLRFISASIFALMGFLTYGLFVAHLLSIFLSALLALRLVSKHYDLRELLMAPMTGPVTKQLRQYGVSIMPAYTIKILFSEFPVMFLNMLLPGAAGAAAGGFYSVARKIASVLQALHKTFEYVMAPLAAERAGKGDKEALTEMLTYATRLSLSVALPLAAALILARNDILAAMRPEFQAASTAIAVLCLGRVMEAATGPSVTVIEMLGHRMLPTLNSLLGFGTLVSLGAILIPQYGVTGAAIAAATGLNVTAFLSLLQSQLLFKLSPYSRLMLQPLLIALPLGAAILSLVPFSANWPIPFGLVGAILSLLIALCLLLRYGLSPADAEPFGKLGRALRR